MQKLTQEEFQERVNLNSNNLYEVISPYLGKDKLIKIRCKKHNCKFEKTADAVMRRNAISCPECKKEQINQQRIKLICSYCGKEFFKTPSKIENSKSGLFFCCREHKDLAQQIKFGLKEIWPEHYESSESAYRARALREYGSKCAHCGFDYDERLLDIHHIDLNRNNNSIENLIPLCVMCHAKITRGIMKVKDRKLVSL